MCIISSYINRFLRREYERALAWIMGGVYLGLILLACAGLWIALDRPAQANHAFDPWKHVESIHRPVGVLEYACAGDTTELDDTAVRRRIINTLKYDNPDLDWHLPKDDTWFPQGNDLISFYMWPQSCSWLATNDPIAYENTPFRYRSRSLDDVRDACRSVGSVYACALWRDPVWVYNNQTPGTAHTDYRYFDIWMWSELLDDANDAPYYGSPDGVTVRRAFVNHETGHALGLADPLRQPDDSYAPCSNDSIMHFPDPYCSDNSWFRQPQEADRRKVNWISINDSMP